MPMLEPWWQALATALAIVWAVFVSCHVVLNKRDVRSAIGWVGLIYLVPWIGGVLYFLLGINRIQRRAVYLRREAALQGALLPEAAVNVAENERISATCLHLADLSVAIGNVTGHRLLGGNAFVPLINGDAAYPSMLQAIRLAKRSITDRKSVV